jgi:hypothetical protein
MRGTVAAWRRLSPPYGRNKWCSQNRSLEIQDKMREAVVFAIQLNKMEHKEEKQEKM